MEVVVLRVTPGTDQLALHPAVPRDKQVRIINAVVPHAQLLVAAELIIALDQVIQPVVEHPLLPLPLFAGIVFAKEAKPAQPVRVIAELALHLPHQEFPAKYI